MSNVVECRRGDKCSNEFCTWKHECGKEKGVCTWGARCTNKKCALKHPPKAPSVPVSAHVAAPKPVSVETTPVDEKAQAKKDAEEFGFVIEDDTPEEDADVMEMMLGFEAKLSAQEAEIASLKLLVSSLTAMVMAKK